MTQRISDADLASGLVGLSSGLKADGYLLDASWHDGRIALDIAAGPDACADCLVSKQMMVELAVSMLGSSGVSVTADDIDLTYPEGSAAH
jgi:hypothetical protein